MKRLAVLVLLTGIVLAASAAPAWAWYAPKQKTAYVTLSKAKGWVEWAGPSNPLNMIQHKDAIPRGYRVVAGMTWLDSEVGAKIAPAVLRETLSFKKKGGGWSFAITDPAKTVKYWSPAYQWDPATLPGVWALDWWVPLGKLKPGTYTGWMKDQALGPVPSWLDDQGNVVATATWLKPWKNQFKHSFTVK